MADREHLARHRLHMEGRQVEGQGVEWTAYCTTCQREGTPTVMLRHVRASRRWRYLGAEEHCGVRYFMWEHQLTGRRYAIPTDNLREYYWTPFMRAAREAELRERQ